MTCPPKPPTVMNSTGSPPGVIGLTALPTATVPVFAAAGLHSAGLDVLLHNLCPEQVEGDPDSQDPGGKGHGGRCQSGEHEAGSVGEGGGRESEAGRHATAPMFPVCRMQPQSEID